MDAALIGMPLSDGWRRTFEEKTGSVPRYLSLPELRRMGWRALLTELWSVRAERLFILLETPGMQALLSVFLCLSAPIRCQQIVVVHHDFTQECTSRWRAVGAIWSVITASWIGRRSHRRAYRQALSFCAQPRRKVCLSDTNRVLYLKTNLWLGLTAGGSVGHVAGVVNSLIAQQKSVDYAAIEPPLMTSPEVNYIPVPAPQQYGLPSEVNLYPFQEEFTHSVRNWLHRTEVRPGLVYQRLSLNNLTGVEISRELGVPLVLEFNSSEVWCSKNWGRKLRYHESAVALEQACLQHAHLIVTVSDVLKDELIERGIEPERIVSHPNGIDEAVFNPSRFTKQQIRSLKDRWNIPAQATIVGFVGTFGPWHGVEKLAEAIRDFATQQRDWLQRHPVHFLIVGDGLGMKAVRQTLADPNCQGLFTLTGLVPQAEAPLYVAACDLMVSPHVQNSDGSRFFGSPTKLFEYLAMGKPVVASDLEQIGEVLADSLKVGALPVAKPAVGERRLAVLTPPGDVSGLMEGIRFLTEQPEWRDVLGANSRREALAKYTWDRHVEAILTGLQRVCPGPTLPASRAA